LPHHTKIGPPTIKISIQTITSIDLTTSTSQINTEAPSLQCQRRCQAASSSTPSSLLLKAALPQTATE